MRPTLSAARPSVAATPWPVAATVALVTAIGGLGCSSPTTPAPLPTLFVTNGTCASGVCRTLEIRAFVWAFPVPQVPPGLEVVGRVRTATACLTFPAQWRFFVTTVGSTDTVFYTWTPSNSSGIMLFAVDSALFYTGGTVAQRDSSRQALWPYDGTGLGSVGHTATFVPGSAAGWTVTFPSTSQSGPAAPGLTPTSACVP